MKNFSQLGVSLELTAALEKHGITSPTPIQEMSIPSAMDSLDILASAPTGTGKTLAYALPLIHGVSSNPQKTALVLVPTRELGMQVFENVKKLISREVKASLLIGGDAIGFQLKGLRNNPNFIIATPGRLNDHIKRGSVNLKTVSFLVLDETDRMLDMGFEEQLEIILSKLPEERQTLMFSATFPHNIMNISKRYLKDPKVLTLSKEQQPMPKIKQTMLRTSPSEKFSHLTKAIDDSDGSVLVFVKTKRSADEITDKLREMDYKACAMHGDLRQNARARTIKRFRDEVTKIMVATDVAARGLDIPHIKYVINYDLPQCKEDYVHRIGRTGRAGAEGISLCLVSPEDNRKWQLIEKMMQNAGISKGIMEDDGYNEYRNNKSTRKPSAQKERWGANKKSKQVSFGRNKGDYSFSEKRTRDKSFDFKSDRFEDGVTRERKPRGNSTFRDSSRPSFASKSDRFQPFEERSTRNRRDDDQSSTLYSKPKKSYSEFSTEKESRRRDTRFEDDTRGRKSKNTFSSRGPKRDSDDSFSRDRKPKRSFSDNGRSAKPSREVLSISRRSKPRFE
jgi:ATP-dependent RNA helicase DeaD